MSGRGCKSSRAHTPFTSKVQTGAGGVAYAAKKGEFPVSKLKGPAKAMYEGMTEEELRSHLKETKGKDLPKRVKK
jgi:hypothetical protein